MKRKYFELTWLIMSVAITSVAGIAVGGANARAQSFSWSPFQQVSQPAPQLQPKTVLIGLDLSRSNPLVRDPGYAARVAERIRPLIADLAPRSRVMLRSFGTYNTDMRGTITLDVTIAPKSARAEDISKLVAQVIANIPTMVSQGKFQAQPDTNIIPFLMNMARVTNCNAMPTHVILASDGIEDSRIVNLRGRNAVLPPPPGEIFPGCTELQILGIGRGMNSPYDTERLIAEWGNWSKAAGFRHFLALNDW
jgi:hypothetical protein